MRLIILLLLFVAAIPCVAFASSTWPNEPAGSALLDCPFTNSSCDGQLAYNTGAIITTDASAPLSPSNVVMSQKIYPSTLGGVNLTYVAKSAIRDLYVGLWWKSDMEGNIVGANKLFFMRAHENSYGGTGTNGVFMAKGLTNAWPFQIIFAHNTTGFDNSHACGEDGFTCYPNVGSGMVNYNAWNRIEAYVHASTTSTSRDGVVRWWVNGQLAGNYTNLNYGGPVVNEWTWNETWDGDLGRNGKGATRDWHHWIDHVRVSTPNCGAAGCPAPPYLVITSALSPARTGIPYSFTLASDGGTKPTTWFLQSGNLPPGLSLSSGGVISGTPTCVGRSNFTIRVTDASQPALTATKSFSIVTSGTGTCTIGMEDSREPQVVTREQENGMRIENRAGTVRFNLPVSGRAQYRLSVYDLAGKKVYEHQSAGQKQISISKDFKNGVYLAKFVQGKQSSTVRFNVMN